MFTGGADELLRGYRMTGTGTGTGLDSEGKEKEKTAFLGDEETLFEYFGAIKRSAGVTLNQGGIEKCSGLHINTAGTLLAAQSTGKIVEIYRLRDDTEAKKKMKRRQKRIREKAEKDKEKAKADSEGQGQVKVLSSQTVSTSTCWYCLCLLNCMTNVISYHIIFN